MEETRKMAEDEHEAETVDLEKTYFINFKGTEMICANSEDDVQNKMREVMRHSEQIEVGHRDFEYQNAVSAENDLPFPETERDDPPFSEAEDDDLPF
jgi:hypothetical protein